MKKMIIDVKLENGAKMPTKANEWDAGFDLYAPKNFAQTRLSEEEPVIVDTGVHMIIPEGYCGLLVSKSGLNVKHGILTTGLIDAGYTGTIRVKMYKHEGLATVVEPCDKISQIVILPIPEVSLREVDALPDTERGENGFGSSGRK